MKNSCDIFKCIGLLKLERLDLLVKAALVGFLPWLALTIWLLKMACDQLAGKTENSMVYKSDYFTGNGQC